MTNCNIESQQRQENICTPQVTYSVPNWALFRHRHVCLAPHIQNKVDWDVYDATATTRTSFK